MLGTTDQGASSRRIDGKDLISDIYVLAMSDPRPDTADLLRDGPPESLEEGD